MNASDLKSRPLKDARRDDVVVVLGALAVNLTRDRPTVRLGVAAFVALVEAKAADTTPLGARVLADAVLKAAPEVGPATTRGEYALQLRRRIARAGYEWSDEDNKPVIPRIPNPRTPKVGGR